MVCRSALNYLFNPKRTLLGFHDFTASSLRQCFGEMCGGNTLFESAYCFLYKSWTNGFDAVKVIRNQNK